MPWRVDPVCDRKIEEESAAAEARYEGAVYYLCSDECRRRFEADPEQYAGETGGGY
jgi:Cu+-exporting ATPase